MLNIVYVKIIYHIIKETQSPFDPPTHNIYMLVQIGYYINMKNTLTMNIPIILYIVYSLYIKSRIP